MRRHGGPLGAPARPGGAGRIGAIVVVAALAAACGRSGGPAPVEYGSGSRALTPPDTYEVERGDTVYEIAQGYGVGTRAVIDANNLSPPYRLRVGQTLEIPPPDRYTVQRGDTLYGISRRFDVDMHALARRNDIQAPYTIFPGDTLLIPDEGGGTRLASASGGDTSTTAAGTTGSTAQSGSQTARDGAGASGGEGGASSADASESGASAPDTSDRERTASGSEASTRDQASRRDADSGTESGNSADDARSTSTAASGRPTFAWPVQGRVLAEFGPQDDGVHNDGINIGAPQGTVIQAAGDGTVVYVGEKLEGFGKLVLIEHADNWITAYAHTAAVLVGQGERVKRGDGIARVGTTGKVSEPQLHFEIREGSRAVDPESLLGPRRTATLPRAAG